MKAHPDAWIVVFVWSVLFTQAACQDHDGDGSWDRDDCKELNAAIHPYAEEVCDPKSVDENCNGLANDDDPSTDESTMTVYYHDVDADGYGDPDSGRLFCEDPSITADWWTTISYDCDDHDPDSGSCPPTPDPHFSTPEPLYFDSGEEYTWGECDSTSWYLELTTVGWAEEYPWVEIYDYEAWGSDWHEVHPLYDLVYSRGDLVDAGYYQIWASELAITDLTTFFQDEDMNTLFHCENIYWLNFIFYAFDFFSGELVCAGVGPDIESFADPSCDMLVTHP